jgi:hypothetical protein
LRGRVTISTWRVPDFPGIGDQTMRVMETVMTCVAAFTAFALVVEVINL